MKRVHGLSAFAALLVLGSSYFALADLGGASGVRIPYQGLLERDGVATNDEVTLRFEVWNQESGGSACWDSGALPTTVTGGRFSVVLGPVAQACVAGRDVWLAVHVDDGAGEVALGDRQRIFPAVAALSSGTGDFHAAGALAAASVSTGPASMSSASIGGTATAASFQTTTGGTVVVNGSANPWTLQADGGDRLYFQYFGGARVSFDGNDSTTIRAQGAIVGSTSPDIAETIPAASDVEAGDVVCADPRSAERAVRCSGDARAVLGVIADGTSTFLINARARSVDAPLTGAPLVLAGRVPVKVSLEGGAIRPGDLLAPSSRPGVAMRATGPGPVVGIALAPFDGGTGDGAVLCFVKVGEGNVAAALRDAAARTAALERTVARLEAQLTTLRGRSASPGARHAQR